MCQTFKLSKCVTQAEFESVQTFKVGSLKHSKFESAKTGWGECLKLWNAVSLKYSEFEMMGFTARALI